MIKFADNNTKQQVYDMWKTVFGDPDNYMELYFRTKYKNENTLIYLKDGKAVASLQMLSFNFTFHGEEIPIYYLSGVCTLPEARKKGYMEQLLLKSFEVCKERGIPLMILVPQEDWLLKFYDKYGFAQTFESNDNPLISLSELISKYPNDLESAYKEFDVQFRNQDMTVQKTFDDFRSIVEEGALWDFPTKNSLIGMTRVIDAERLLSIFSKNTIVNGLILKIKDKLISENNLEYVFPKIDEGIIASSQFSLDIRDLVQLLLGYKIKDKALKEFFVEKNPQIHYMLE